MLLAHELTLGEARSHLAALADQARSADASIEYDRVLLRLDAIHLDAAHLGAWHDNIPGISPVPVTDRDALFAVAESAIEDLTGHGVDALSVELVLDLLYTARELDTP